MLLRTTLALLALAALTLVPGAASAQDAAAPLTVQGLDHQAAVGARARAMGGVRASGLSTSAALFSNPAALHRLTEAEVRLGGGAVAQSLSQDQTWVPNRLYLELSLIFENDPTSPNPTRAFDDITPDWETDLSSARPTLGSAAVPLPFAPGGVAVTAGLGAAQVADLDHYFQNNNALDPNIGDIRPAPIPRVQDGDSLMVGWAQFSRQREGAVYGITPALALARGPFSLGLSATVLTGSSDDTERTRDRGEFTLRYQNRFSLAAPTGGETTTTGTSDYSGTRIAVAGGYETGALSVDAVWQPGYTLSRDWSHSDGTAGTDEVRFAPAFTVGAAVRPSDRVTLAADVDLRALGSAEVLYADSTEADQPWVSGSTVHLGAEYRALDWLALRGGYREQAQAFAPAGAALLDEPARADVFGAGLGLSFGPLALDVTYELSSLRYEDLWLSNGNDNSLTTHAVLFEAAYALPFAR
ncbi:hypothetical protein [Rubrivirga marina]|uniref:Aromatic hydrocarbon degradation protein n=1 Tax=Rubrivirga marina TaxID=1196024 RepID=A0A271IYU9_9BACT|nr:hypothetical protein [Rubrivirga marina]PAP75875.1 hypothetical protein BSZ37_05180 [Rubrivirga marina]